MLYLLDTNAVSDIQRRKYNVRQRMKEELSKGNQVAICPVVYYEIVRGLKVSNAARKLEQFNNIFQYWQSLPLDETATQKAAEISIRYNLEGNDVYIAAVALANNCTLVTANDKHFSRIDGLKVENWR